MHPRKKKALSRQQPTNPRQLIPLIIIGEITGNLHSHQRAFNINIKSINQYQHNIDEKEEYLTSNNQSFLRFLPNTLHVNHSFKSIL